MTSRFVLKFTLPRLRIARSHFRVELSVAFLIVVLLVASTVDLPLAAKFGDVSLSAILTSGIAAAAWLLWMIQIRFPLRSLIVVLAGAGFLLWLLITAGVKFPTSLGMQNLVVLFGFIGLILLSMRISLRHPDFSDTIARCIGVGLVVAVSLFATAKLNQWFGTDFVLSIQGQRLLPLYALIPLSWSLSRWKRGSSAHLVIAVGILLMILVDLSRMALVVGFVLFVLAQLHSSRRIPWLRLAFWGVLMTVGLLWLITKYEPLRARFFEYDNTLVIGDVAINSMGRTRIWNAVLQSVSSSPFIGHGAGSSAQITQSVAKLDHPHNEYLRLLHDYGGIGLALWLLLIVAILVVIWGLWRRTAHLRTADGTIHQAAFLALVGCSITMMSDNPLSYSFVMFPLAILIGASIGQPVGHNVARNKVTQPPEIPETTTNEVSPPGQTD